jgi:hypothetical protein
MDRRETLAEGILATKTLLARYLVGFDDSNHTRMADKLPNHVAWTLGHLALTMHRVAEKLDGRQAPPGDFLPAGATAHQRAGAHAERVSPYSVVPVDAYDPESVAFGSKPLDDPRQYPPFTRCGQIYNAACDRLAAAVRAVDDAKLDQTVKWGQADLPLWSLLIRMVFHNGTHTGQLADLRRAMGFKSIFA